MRRVLSLFLLGGLLIAVHALPQAKLRAKRGFNLFKMFNNKRAEIQNNADGANKSPPAQEPKSNIFELAPPAPPAPPPAPPIQDVEGSWCAPGWYHAQIASECIKIFEGEQDIVTLVEAKRNCEQLPSYMGESASLLEVSAGKPNAAVNQYIKDHSSAVGNLWITTQYDSGDYVINKSTGVAVMESPSKKHGYVCGAEPGRDRRIRKK